MGLAIVLVIGIAVGVVQKHRVAPGNAIARFYEHAREPMVAEDQLGDPLILAGAPAVPHIVREATRREMPLRRYAIGALGAIGSPEAAPFLVDLVEDESEVDYVRADALIALWQVGWKEERQLAERLSGRPGVLGLAAGRLLAEGAPPRRSRLDAILGKHE